MGVQIKKKIPPYWILGTPDPGDGRRIVDHKELMHHMKRPSFQAAMQRINNIEGKPREVQRLTRAAKSEGGYNQKMIVDRAKRGVELQTRKHFEDDLSSPEGIEM